MKINCPVSLGELVDKLSILMIKCQFIEDPLKLRHVKKEKGLLENILYPMALPGMNKNLEELVDVNSKLWVVEEKIRGLERVKDFGPGFISLARSVYQLNDRRYLIKSRINDQFGSPLKEIKSYGEL